MAKQTPKCGMYVCTMYFSVILVAKLKFTILRLTRQTTDKTTDRIVTAASIPSTGLAVAFDHGIDKQVLEASARESSVLSLCSNQFPKHR